MARSFKLWSTVALQRVSDLCQSGFGLLAFDHNKEALTTAPVLVMPGHSQPFELVADAGGFGVGAAVLQEGQPIVYVCKQFSPAERSDGEREQELLGVISAMRTWQCSLEGVSADSFTIVTDDNRRHKLPEFCR